MGTIAYPLAAATVPNGFTDSIVASGVTGPTAMEFAPDGRLFVCLKAGPLRIIKNGELLPTPFMTVTVDTLSERGLLGLTFDPGFTTNHFLYAYYTAPTPSIHNRVSRFTANGDTVVAGSELVLLNLNTLGASDHNGGAIHFGSDGKLYIAAGDNTISANAQSLGTLLGKISRLNPDGTIPADNPFFNTASGVNRAIWALGFRNPFTFAFQPGTGRLFINDVGFTSWEEINEGASGANYGWPTCEGACSPANGFRNPFFQYGHLGGDTNLIGCAIVGGAFYNPPTNNFPLSYVGSYFFADYCNGWIRRLDTGEGNAVTSFASNLSSTVDLKVGADGCLYYLTRGDNSVHKIQSFINPPNFTAQPASQTVTEGTLAAFSVGASGAAPLHYQWQRNGTNFSGTFSNALTLGPTLLAESGSLLSCVVTNLHGSVTSNPALLLVNSNQDPMPLITWPAVGSSFGAGDTIPFEGAGADPEDGPLPPGAFSWTIEFHHETHTHPFLGPLEGITNGTFFIPTQGETSPNVWYRIELTVTDSLGKSRTALMDITPRTSAVTLATSPPGLQLTLDGQPLTAPAADISVVGLTRALGVTSPQSLGGVNFVFVGWSDGGPADHDINMPVTNTTYTAAFLAAPFVTAQPASQAVTQLSSVAFTAQAGGAEPLRFQWRHDGLNLPGETNATLTLSRAQPPDAGEYSVQINNPVGSTTSDAATLTVLVPPSITAPLQSLTVTNGGMAAFAVAATGTAPLDYQWYYYGTNLLANETNAILTITNVQPLHSGEYSVQVNNLLGAAASDTATLTVLVPPSIVSPPRDTIAINGDTVTFSIAADGTAPLSFEWFFQGTNLLAGETADTLTISNVARLHAGSYSVQVANSAGSVTSDPAVLTVLLPPSITLQPHSLAVTNSSPAAFSVAASGTAPLSYQWRFHGADLAGQNNSTLSLSTVSFLDTGDYSVIVANDFGTVASAVAALTVEAAPVITGQPQSLIVTNGNFAEFTVTAIGSAPLAYQWYHRGTNLLAGETNGTLTITNAANAHAGDYSVQVTNAVGAALSDPATLTVLSPPSIVAPPQSRTTANGATFSFHVTAAGTAPLLYQWRFHGTDLTGETNDILTLAQVTPANAGDYATVVANAYGAVTSSVATLSVLFPPSIASHPQSVAVTNGGTATFRVETSGSSPIRYQWFFQTTNVLAGETNDVLTLQNVSAAATGDYAVQAANEVGEVRSDPAALTVLLPPVITVQPQSRSVIEGNAVTLTISASGTAPLTYQWHFNGNDLGGQTGSALLLNAVTTNDAGHYSVIVANPYGTVTSAEAMLTVLPLLEIVAQPQGTTVTNGGAANFAVTAGGRPPFRYQWVFQGTNVLADQTNDTLNIPDAQAIHAGSYAVRVGNDAGEQTSAAATLTVRVVPSILEQPQSVTATNGGMAAFNATFIGTGPLSYQWRFNGAALPGQTEPALLLSNTTTNEAGQYTLVASNLYGSATSAVATMTVLVPPTLLAPPPSLIVTNHATVLFGFGATGSQPLACQWFFNSTNALAGATNDTLLIANASPGHAGNYSVRVSNAAGVVTSAPATLVVLVPPVITSQPQSRTTTNGATAAFILSADGTSPLALQWYFQGTNALTGETNATLTLTPVQSAHAGEYTVLVSNSAGAVTSLPATLTVRLKPFILAQPASLTVTNGLTASFNVLAGGTAPLSYQWFFNKTTLLAGQTGPTLIIPATQPSDTGNYSARVNNNITTVTSAVATLTIAPISSSWPARAALQFDGVDDSVEIPDSAALNISGPITVEAWIFRSAMGVQHSVVEKYGCNGLGGYALRVTAADKLLFGTRDDCSNGSSVPGATTLLSNTWYHVAGTWDGAALRVFVNGVADAPPFPSTRNPKPGATPLRLGARGNDLATPFKGVIDEVRVWNVARPPADLQAGVYRRMLGNEPGLAAYWRLDDGLGLTAGDSTVNANTGTLTNGPVWIPSTAPLGLPGIAATLANNVTPTTATLGGAITLNTESATAFFQWGATPLYGETISVQNLSGGPGSASLTATLETLTPGVTYHFRLGAFNEIGTNFGPDVTLTTPTAPAATTLPASNVASRSATLNGAINPNAAPTTAWFEWGLTTGYASTTPALNPGSGTSLVPVMSALTGLSPGAIYHCRLAAANVAGTNYGADEIFSIPGIPVILTLAATGITTNAATLNAAANPNGSSTADFFQWGTTTNYTDATSLQDVGSGALSVSAAWTITGWQPGTLYHFRALATNRFGTVFGADQIVATLPIAGETALLFDGLNDQVVVPDSVSLRVSGPITVEAWIRRSVTGVQHAIVEKYGCQGDAPLVGGYALRVTSDNKLVFRTEDDCSTGTSATGATSLQSNVWYHVAGLWDGGQLRVYVNGVLDGVTVTSRNPKPGNTPLRIGERGNTLQPMFGAIDEVRLWSVARTQPELQSNLSRRLTGSEPGLVAYWRFDEGTGLTAADATGHGNTGTLLDGPVWVTGLNFSGQTTSQRPGLAINMDLANSAIHIHLTGLYGTTLVLEISTNLSTWSPLRTFPSLSGAVEYSDTLGGNPGGRFYRVRQTQ